MSCIPCSLCGKVLYSRTEGAQLLQLGPVRAEQQLHVLDFGRRKPRSGKVCIAASWPAGDKQRELQIGQPAPAQQQSPSSSILQQKPLIAAAAAAVALISLLVIRGFTRKPKANHDKLSEGSQDSQLQNTADSKDFKVAVARTRQAVSVQKAIGFMDASSPAKAIVELRRALEENSVARASILHMRYESRDLLNLYKLHLQNTEMPPNFATLLQLREMLAISELDAERMEKDVYESGAAFSI